MEGKAQGSTLHRARRHHRPPPPRLDRHLQRAGKKGPQQIPSAGRSDRRQVRIASRKRKGRPRGAPSALSNGCHPPLAQARRMSVLLPPPGLGCLHQTPRRKRHCPAFRVESSYSWHAFARLLTGSDSPCGLYSGIGVSHHGRTALPSAKTVNAKRQLAKRQLVIHW